MKPLLFGIGTLLLSFVSRKSLLHFRSHGFFRFLAWEALLGSILLNYEGWFRTPLAWHQLISWVLLVTSLFLVFSGLKQLRDTSKYSEKRIDSSLFEMEKTSRLVTSGLYGWIRHPLYSSLLFLSWGIFFKSPSWMDGGLSVLTTFFLLRTARVEERENIDYFGDEYEQYMQRTKMFIPYVY